MMWCTPTEVYSKWCVALCCGATDVLTSMKHVRGSRPSGYHVAGRGTVSGPGRTQRARQLAVLQARVEGNLQALARIVPVFFFRQLTHEPAKLYSPEWVQQQGMCDMYAIAKVRFLFFSAPSLSKYHRKAHGISLPPTIGSTAAATAALKPWSTKV